MFYSSYESFYSKGNADIMGKLTHFYAAGERIDRCEISRG